MQHHASSRFWKRYRELSPEHRMLAKKSYALLARDPNHPSITLKKVGRYWAARVGLAHRALATEVDGGLLWVWIGTHDEYDRLIG